MRRRLLLSQFRRGVRAVAAAAVPCALAGCGQATGSFSHQVASVRIMDASPNAGPLDVYANSTGLTYNVGFGTVSSYIAFAPGGYTLGVRPAGSAAAVAATRSTLQQGQQYTLLLGNVAAGLESELLPDQTRPAPAGRVALRIVDQVTRMGALDVYLVPQGSSAATTVPLLAAVNFRTAGVVPPYLDAPAGAYALVVLPAGTSPALAPAGGYSGPVTIYPSGSAWTVVLLDGRAGGGAVQAIAASDYDPATVVP